MIIISACLIGVNCKYNGGHNLHPKFLPLIKDGKLVPVCPEQLGGLTTPRTPAEIVLVEKGSSQNGGHLVLTNKAKVVTKEGIDVTNCFLKGASETLKIAQVCGAKKAILKERSPSCGVNQIYDGSFSGEVVSGQGVTGALLALNGIQLISDEEAIKF